MAKSASSLSALSVPEEILALAGADLERRVALTRKSLRVVDEAMDATMVERVTHQGAVTAEYHDIDHRTRLSGADRWAEMQGLKRSKSAEDKGAQKPITYVVVIQPAPAPRHVDAHVVDEA